LKVGKFTGYLEIRDQDLIDPGKKSEYKEQHTDDKNGYYCFPFCECIK
jgi:hypothetical protein